MQEARGRPLAGHAHAQRFLPVHVGDAGLGPGRNTSTRFSAVQDKIRAGDIYQLNLTFKARFRLEGSPLTFYRDLRQRQRVAYAGIVDTGEVTVLSAQPGAVHRKARRASSRRGR